MTPPDHTHEMKLLELRVGDDPPFMYQAQCSCSWKGVETSDRAEAVADGRHHWEARQFVKHHHPWDKT